VNRRTLTWTALAAGLALVLASGALHAALLAGAVAGVVAVRALPAVRARLWRGLIARGRAPRDGILLGSDVRGRPVALQERELAAHGLILGASGAGKSTSLLAILTERILAGAPVIAIDLKGAPELASQLQDACAAAGRPLRRFSIDGSERWNPLGHGGPSELKDKLIATERFTEPHYQRAAERYVQLALRVAAELHPDRPATLTEVIGLMEPARLAATLRGAPAALASAVGDYLRALTPDQLSAVRGLQTRLALLSESQAGALLESGGDIDLRRALAGEEVVLFSLNSSRYGSLAAQLGTLAVQDLVAAAGDRLERHRAPPLATVAIDEFSALGGDQVLALIARGRGSAVSVLLATQELADLERAGRGFADQVVGSTALKLIHRQEVPRSVDLVARMAGTHEEWEHTYALGAGPLGDGRLGAHASPRGTRRRTRRFNVEPDALRQLRPGEAVRISAHASPRTQIVRVAPPRQRPGAVGQAGSGPTRPSSGRAR
jgi:conjugal transfer pilus assembly protein TraD